MIIDKDKRDYYCPTCHENTVGRSSIAGMFVEKMIGNWACSNCSWTGNDGALVASNEGRLAVEEVTQNDSL